MSVTAVDIQPVSTAATGTARLLASPVGVKPASFPDASPNGFVIKGGGLSAASLLPSKATPSLPAYHLMPEPRGALQNLVAKAVPTTEVAPGKVLVAVKAVGINFRWAGSNGRYSEEHAWHERPAA